MAHLFDKNRNLDRILRSMLFSVLLFVSVVVTGFFVFAPELFAEGTICVRGECLDGLRDLPVHGSFGTSLKIFQPSATCQEADPGYGPYCYNEDDFKEINVGGGYCDTNTGDSKFKKTCATEYESKVTNTTGPLCIKGRCYNPFATPRVDSFTVNGESIGTLIDYCEETVRLDWETADATNIAVSGERINEDLATQASNFPNGYIFDIRPKKDALYSLVAINKYSTIDSNKQKQSSTTEVPVYVYRSRCFENCVLGKIEEVLPAARAAKNSLLNGIGAACTVTKTALKVGATVADSLAGTEVLFQAADILINATIDTLCLGAAAQDEFNKKNGTDYSQVCRDKLPDEDFNITELFENILNGFSKGATSGIILGLINGIFSTAISAITGLISCNPFVNGLISFIFNIMTSQIVSELEKQLNISFIGVPDPNHFGEGIGYNVGVSFFRSVAEDSVSLIGSVLLGNEAGNIMKDICKIPVEINPTERPPRTVEVPNPPSDPSSPAPKSSSGVLLVGTQLVCGSVRNFSEESSRQTRNIDIIFQTIEVEDGSKEVLGVVQPDDLTFKAKDVGKNIISSTGKFGKLTDNEINSFALILLRNTQSAMEAHSDWTPIKALTNEFTNMAKKKWPDISEELINKYVTKPKFMDLAQCLVNSNQCSYR